MSNDPNCAVCDDVAQPGDSCEGCGRNAPRACSRCRNTRVMTFVDGRPDSTCDWCADDVAAHREHDSEADGTAPTVAEERAARFADYEDACDRIGDEQREERS